MQGRIGAKLHVLPGHYNHWYNAELKTLQLSFPRGQPSNTSVTFLKAPNERTYPTPTPIGFHEEAPPFLPGRNPTTVHRDIVGTTCGVRMGESRELPVGFRLELLDFVSPS
jgi:hypothetical protein